MNLTTVQINQIKKYCNHTSKYYDVEIELVDHIAAYIEDRMEHEADFERLFEYLKTKFSKTDIALIVKEKKHSILQKARTQCWNEFLSYFSWPKIGLTFLLTALVIIIDLNINIEKKFPAMFHILNLLNLSYGYGKFRITTKNIKEIIQPVLSLHVIYKFHLLSISPMLIYLFLSITKMNDSITIPIEIYKISLYVFPIFILHVLAWRKTYIDLHIKIRTDYSNAFSA
ncbi:MAG: hypothetical protein Q8K64_16040 [Sediminibacterium sp.]|nr:hypothetical protein [Sediminibacterium sp.]TXT33291.1 MAG: hypothetical protein FD136_983 [Chitinophagaceae bacterium]